MSFRFYSFVCFCVHSLVCCRFHSKVHFVFISSFVIVFIPKFISFLFLRLLSFSFLSLLSSVLFDNGRRLKNWRLKIYLTKNYKCNQLRLKRILISERMKIKNKRMFDKKKWKKTLLPVSVEEQKSNKWRRQLYFRETTRQQQKTWT